jgi:hypothetical protein
MQAAWNKQRRLAREGGLQVRAIRDGECQLGRSSRLQFSNSRFAHRLPNVMRQQLMLLRFVSRVAARTDRQNARVDFAPSRSRSLGRSYRCRFHITMSNYVLKKDSQ